MTTAALETNYRSEHDVVLQRGLNVKFLEVIIGSDMLTRWTWFVDESRVSTTDVTEAQLQGRL